MNDSDTEAKIGQDFYYDKGGYRTAFINPIFSLKLAPVVGCGLITTKGIS